MVDVFSVEGSPEAGRGSVPKVGPRRAWFAVAAFVAVASVVGGTMLGIHGWRASFGQIDDYPRVEVPDRTTVTLDRGEYTLYAEYPANGWWYDPYTPAVSITDTDRDQRITVHESSSSGSYTMDGRRGVSMGTVSIPRHGRYQVVTSSEGSNATGVAFGDDVLPGFLLGVFGGVALAGVGVLVAAIVVVVVAVQRSRARRRLGHGGHLPAGGVAGAWTGPPMASWSTPSPPWPPTTPPWPSTTAGPRGQWASPSGGPSGPGPWDVPPEQRWPAPPSGTAPGVPPGAPGSWDAPPETRWPGTTPSAPVPWGMPSPPAPPGGPGCEADGSPPGPSDDPNDPGWAAPMPGAGEPVGFGPGDGCSADGTGTADRGSYDSGGSDSGSYDSGSYDSGSYDSGSYDSGGGDLGS
jgi:hypothetical protein